MNGNNYLEFEYLVSTNTKYFFRAPQMNLSVHCDPLSYYFFISHKRSSPSLFTYESLAERELIQAVDIISEETYDHSLFLTQLSLTIT